MSVIVQTKFVDAPRIKRESYVSNRIKYVGINFSTNATTSASNWKITKYSDDDFVSDQQTLEDVVWDDRDSLPWAF